MKKQTLTKLLVVFIAVLMLGIATTITVFADTSTSAYVSSDTNVYREEEITFTVGINNGDEIRSILVIPEYDSESFELIGGDWTLSNENEFADFSVSSGDAVILFKSGISVDGNVLTFTLKTKNDAVFGTYSVSAEVVITDSQGTSTLNTSPATVQIKCNHSFTKEDTTYLKSAATCTNRAVYYKSCVTCGEKGTATFEYGTTEPHSYTRQVITDDYKMSGATCTAKAVYNYCCATCDKAGDTTYESGETLTHSYTRQVITDAYKVSSADCDSKAVYNYCCTTCDAKGTETFEYGEVLGHTGGTATCTAKAVCTRCSQEYGNTLEHVYTAEDATATYLKSAATCTSKAVYYKNCATCDKAGTDTFKYGTTEPHSYTRQVITDDYKVSGATCTAKAVYYYCCATCDTKGTTTYEDGTTLPHSYTRQVITDDYKVSSADCDSKAVYNYCCVTCDDKGTDTFEYGDVLGHTGGTATCTAKAECTRCSQEYGTPANHTPNTDDGDCTTEITCSVCGSVTTAGAASHTGGTATCKEKAKCSVCGKEYGSLGDHAYSNLIPVAAEKHTKTELAPSVSAHYRCSDCGKYFTESKVETTLEELTGTMPSHSYGSWTNNSNKHWKECSCGLKSEEASHVNSNGDSKCDVCDRTLSSGGSSRPSHTHRYSEATCTKKATCSCGATKGDLAPHKLSEATCAAKAKCSVCGTEVGELLAHNYVDGKCVCGATDPNYVTETEPVETEPVETEPVETEPVETEPVETEPVETEPVETNPVETDPTTPVTPTEPGDGDATGFSSTIIIGAVSIIVIAIACGAVIFLKKKKA